VLPFQDAFAFSDLLQRMLRENVKFVATEDKGGSDGPKP
jgi:hypothetical protein